MLYFILSALIFIIETTLKGNHVNGQLRCPPLLCVQAKRGGLRDTDATDLLATVFKAVLTKTAIDPKVHCG